MPDKMSPVRASFSNGVKRLTMCDMKKTRNSLSLEMMKALNNQLKSNTDDPSLRSIVISSEGQVFSSGHNLKELVSTNDRRYLQSVFAECTKLMLAIRDAPVPVIAQVSGTAAAAGCQLVAMCDMAVATETSTFSLPGSNIGLFCSTPGIVVSRRIPRSLLAYLLFTGNSITATEAQRFGLISKVVKDDDLGKEIDSLTESINRKSRSVIEMGKKFLYQQLEMDLETALRKGEDVMVENLLFQDCQEGIDAFFAKRSPAWSHTDNKVTP